MQYNLVSGDDHMDLAYLPRDLFQQRVAAKFKDVAPRVETTPEGRRHWFSEGKFWDRGEYGTRSIYSNTAFSRAGVPEEPEPWVFRSSKPELRLADMDRDGVDLHVIYGPSRPLQFSDQALGIACIEAYNTWLSEFCSVAPQRLVGIAMLPMHDPAATAREITRVAKLGLKGAVFNSYHAPKPVYDEAWEPVWAAAAESGVPLSFHLGGGVRNAKTTTTARGQLIIATSLLPMQLDEPLVEIVICGALEKFPGLKIVLAEAGLGWVPYVVQRMDQQYKRMESRVKITQMLPSELFRRQVFVTFEEEDVSLDLIRQIGEDNVIWSSDYPHSDSTWPNSQAYLDKHMAGIPADVRKKLTCTNTLRLLNLV